MKLRAHYQDARILIVDDAPDNVKLLERILGLAGFKNVRSTTDPREAPELFRQMQPHAVLLDLNMPHLDGFQVMERLSQLEDGA